METFVSINLISTNPQVRNGRPCIGGTTLRVSDVVIATLFHDRSPGQIAADYAIALAQVHAALAYYYEHQPELDAEIRQQLEKDRTLKEQCRGLRHTPI